MLTADSRHAYDQVIRSACGACPAGCGIAAYVKDGCVVDLLGDEAHPLSRGALCARGTAVFQHFGHAARLRQPGIRQALDHEFAPCSWDEALNAIAGRVKSAAAAHGPAAVVVAGADRLEAANWIGAARLAAALGARHLPSAAAPDAAAAEVFGAQAAPWLTVPAAEWALQGCLLLVGGDPANDFPVAFRHVLEARARRVPVLAAAPRFTATLARSDFALCLRPGSEAVFLFALFKAVCESGALEAGREAHLAGLDAWRAAAAELEWPAVERLTGQPQAAVQRAGVMWALHQPGVIIGGAAVTPAAARAAAGLLALSRALGTSGRPAGWNWLAEPPWPFEGGTQAAAEPPAPRVVLGSGDFWPQLPAGEQAQAEFVVHFGAYPDESWQHAHVTLPAASWAEVEGLHAGHDRRLQWQAPLAPPPGQARGALEFWTALADRLGLGDAFPWRAEGGQADVRACCEALLGGVAGLDAGACRAPGGATWPAGPAVDQGGAPVRLGAPPDLAVPEPDRGHPLLLCRDVPAAGDAAWWPWLRAGESAVFQLNPAVAAALDIENDAPIWVDDGQRRLAGRACVTPAVPLHTVWAAAGAPAINPVVVFRQQDHMLQSLARLRGLFARMERRT